jgi:hypothetical protein
MPRSLGGRLLALAGIIPTDDIHSAYAFLETLVLGNSPVTVAKWPSTRYHVYWPNWLKRPLTLAYNHLALAAQIARGALAGRVVIVREFNNVLLLLLLPLIWPLRSQLLLNINDNLAPENSRVSRLSLVVLRRLGFRMLLLDGEAVPAGLLRKHAPIRLLTPYFAVSDRRRSARPHGLDGKLVVGFVGYFRRDKGGLEALVEAVRKLRSVPGVMMALGYWNREQVEALPADVKESVLLRETLRHEDYSEFLYSCDAVVVLASESYRLRHSGILVDTLSRGTLAICPAFPLLSCQALRPVPVGATYGSLADLPEAVKAVQENRARLLRNFDEYLRRRSCRSVSVQLAAQWERGL